MIFREWQAVAPAYWNEAQLTGYIHDSTLNLAVGIAPVVQITTPLGAANILLAVLVKVARENPAWTAQILDAMASVAEALDNMPVSPQVH